MDTSIANYQTGKGTTVDAYYDEHVLVPSSYDPNINSEMIIGQMYYTCEIDYTTDECIDNAYDNQVFYNSQYYEVSSSATTFDPYTYYDYPELMDNLVLIPTHYRNLLYNSSSFYIVASSKN